jgi:RNA polymerase sigma-70 factor, ECF subfamily
MATDAEARELELRAFAASGDLERATTETLRTYGSELIGWLCSILPSEADAQDAFSWSSEELWKSLSRFDGRCSLRTWCYMLARQGAARVRNRPSRERELLVSQIPSVHHAATHIWNTTRRDEHRVRDVYAEIRATLPEEDQTLLVLRVDRGLAWRDIAIVLLGEAEDGDAVTKRAASLRKQFERVKAQLRELAAERLRD